MKGRKLTEAGAVMLLVDIGTAIVSLWAVMNSTYDLTRLLCGAALLVVGYNVSRFAPFPVEEKADGIWYTPDPETESDEVEA